MNFAIKPPASRAASIALPVVLAISSTAFASSSMLSLASLGDRQMGEDAIAPSVPRTVRKAPVRSTVRTKARLARHWLVPKLVPNFSGDVLLNSSIASQEALTLLAQHVKRRSARMTAVLQLGDCEIGLQL